MTLRTPVWAVGDLGLLLIETGNPGDGRARGEEKDWTG